MASPLRSLDDRVGNLLTRRIFDRFGPVGQTDAAPQVRTSSEGSTVEVSRAIGGRQDRVRSYRIFLDDLQVGELRAGETWVSSVAPGRHTLWLKIDWTGSAQATFSIDAGETAHYQCRAYDVAFRPIRQRRAFLRGAPWIEWTRPES